MNKKKLEKSFCHISKFELSMNGIHKHLFFSWHKVRFSKLNYRSLNFDNKNKVLRMNEAYFKHLQDEGKIAISFRYIQDINENKRLDRVFNFVRDVTENIEVSLNRIRSNLEKELTKKSKKKVKKNQQPPPENVAPSDEVQVGLIFG